MKYHKFRFGLKGNIKVLMCRLFGHRLNENPQHHWCERCGLEYGECYYPKNYWMESGNRPHLRRLLRETIMRTNIALPMNEEDNRWWDEGTDANKIRGDFFFEVAEFIGGIDERELPDYNIKELLK